MITIQVDTREKARAIDKILKTFNDLGINVISSKMYVGDYMLYSNPFVVIDRKKNIGELAGNICGKQHKRFSAELMRAKENDIKVIILIEYDYKYRVIEDIKKWKSTYTKIKGDSLYKAIKTMEAETDKYNVEFRICNHKNTGIEILKILSEFKKQD